MCWDITATMSPFFSVNVVWSTAEVRRGLDYPLASTSPLDRLLLSLTLAAMAELSWNARKISWSFGFVKQLGCVKLVVGDETIFTSLDVINCNHMCQGQNASCTLARRLWSRDVRILLCPWCSDSLFFMVAWSFFLYDSMTLCCLVENIPTTSYKYIYISYKYIYIYHKYIYISYISYSHLKAHNLPQSTISFLATCPFIFSMQRKTITREKGVYNWPWRVSTTGKACHQRSGGTHQSSITEW